MVGRTFAIGTRRVRGCSALSLRPRRRSHCRQPGPSTAALPSGCKVPTHCSSLRAAATNPNSTLAVPSKSDHQQYASVRGVPMVYISSMSPAPDRRTILTEVVRSYFEGLRCKDVSRIPWSDSVTFRAPLSQGGSETLLRGRAAVESYIKSVVPTLADVRVIDVYVNQSLTAAVGKAELYLANGNRLRVADLFEVNGAGEIVSQENHYDPRPACPTCTNTG